MSTYATVIALRDIPAVGAASPPTDAELDAVLVEAEDLLDRIAGPISPNNTTGRKLTPAALPLVARAALARATLILAAELHRNPEALHPAQAASISGPDFSLSNVRDGSPGGANALRRAAALLDAHRLRVLTATLR